MTRFKGEIRDTDGQLIGTLNKDPIIIGIIEDSDLQVDVQIIDSGPTGPVGPVGPVGPQGRAGKDAVVDYALLKQLATFSFEQASPATTWYIEHNLGFYPSVFTVTYGGHQIQGAVYFIDENNVEVSFTKERQGYAYLS